MPTTVDIPGVGTVAFPDEMSPAQVRDAAAKMHGDAAQGDESAVSRFAGGVWKNASPIAIAQGLYGAVRHPVDTVVAAKDAMGDQWSKARDLASNATGPGDYVEAAGHAVAGTLPFVGPAAASAGERIGRGDIAGGLGEGVGLLVPTLAPHAIRGAVRGVGALAPGLADAMDAGAASKVADAMTPKVGANKTRFANNAERVAPALVKDLASDGAPMTRSGFHAQVQSKLAQAEQGLDAASDARLQGQTFSPDAMIEGLKAKRAALTSKASGTGTDVVPAPNSARVAVIDQAISELKQLSQQAESVYDPKTPSVVGYDPIRVMRQAYDGQAKVVYNPSMTADFLKQKGAALGASDVTGVLRDQLAKWDPETAKANAQYSLYRTADDVMKATAEVERARPKVGRQIIARMTGTIIGEQAGGVPGAMVGYIAGPILDSALASGMTTQLKTAALMSKLADAIRRGDIGAVYDATHSLKRIGATAAAAGQPSGSPSDQSAPLVPATQ